MQVLQVFHFGGRWDCRGVGRTRGDRPKMNMESLPLRLQPNSNLRGALEVTLDGRLCRAAFVIEGVGSLRQSGTIEARREG